MGCDIHIALEKQVADKWVLVNRVEGPARKRNYERFAKLAGVRGEGPAPKGLPADISAGAHLFATEWSEDGHSWSWLPMYEARRIWPETEWCGPAEKPPSDPEYYYFGIDTDTSRGRGLYRVIFWFDN